MAKAVRQIRVDGCIAYVPLTRGYEAVIDAEDAASAYASASEKHYGEFGRVA